MNNFLNRYFCQILTFNEEDYHYFLNRYSNSGVEVLKYDDKFKYSGLPVQIIGQENVLNFQKELNQVGKKLGQNYFWTVSPSKDKNQANIDSELFIKNTLYNFSGYETISYDAILNGDFINFLKSKIDSNNQLYLYFQERALYLFANNIVFCCNLESIKYIGLDVKTELFRLLATYQCIVFSYDNFRKYLPEKFEGPVITFENIFWIRNLIKIELSAFINFFNGNETYKNIPYLMGTYFQDYPLTEEEVRAANRFYKKDIACSWLSGRKVTLLNPSTKKITSLKLQHSNKRTITGRINITDKRLNPQMLAKDSPIRANILSSFKDGKIAIFDYVSFETKIALHACGDKEFIQKFKDKDLHAETASVVLQTEHISTEQRSIGKHINHTLLYGGGDEKLMQLIKAIPNKEEALVRVKEFLSPIINKSEDIQQEFKELGYIINPFGIIIRPQKSWAAFNNFIQSTAADIVVNQLMEVKNYLKSNKLQSDLMYQVHDSFVFDLHPDEMYIVDEIKNLLSHYFTLEFSVDYKIGKNLQECTVIGESTSDDSTDILVEI